MSMFMHNHEAEGFDDEWAKAMKPLWDKQAAENRRHKLFLISTPEGSSPMYEMYSNLMNKAVGNQFKLMTEHKDNT